MTTTRTPQPLTGPFTRRYAPGIWQVPTIVSGSHGQPAMVVRVALVRGEVATATSTTLPANAAPVSDQPVPLASVHQIPTPSAANATLVAA